MLRRSDLYQSVSVGVMLLAIELPSSAHAAVCTTDSSGNVTCANGAITAPITLYDAAAAYQPIGGSNSYIPANPLFPAGKNPNNPGYNPNPSTITLTLANMTSFDVTANSASSLADKGLIVANYSNSENPAVNNVVINTAAALSLTTGQIAASRMHVIVSDSQVNNFTVNNQAGGTISATQTFFNSGFSASKLNTSFSTSALTYSAQYNGNTLNIISALYSDDNTNSFTLNNSGTVSATGNYAAAYYGRADTTITNSGTIQNTSWSASDTLAAGHWAIAAYAGADFATVAGSNPDTPLYAVTKITLNAQNQLQGNIQVLDTSALTLTNTGKGVLKGDILAVDSTPLVIAAGLGSGQTQVLSVSGSNSGPRDSSIANYGTIYGNLYLGSGAHVIDNSGTWNGNMNVDQRGGTGVFAAGIAGTVSGTYKSSGTGTGSTGAACPAAGVNTTDPYCAATQNVLASYYGSRTFTLTNEGTLTGNISINDQAGAVNSIKLTGSGFSGSVTALNGLGSNSLTLQGVTQLNSVQHFQTLNLTTSQVHVANGIQLDGNAKISTTIFGAGGSQTSPSANLGTIFGKLTLSGATNITPIFAGVVRNGDVYQLASSASGTNISVANTSALVNLSPNTSSGALLLKASVLNPVSIFGLSQPGNAALQNLLSYSGASTSVQNLGGAVESVTSLSQVKNAGEALQPIVNGASIQVPLNTASLFQSQIDTRIDSLVYQTLVPGEYRSIVTKGEAPAAQTHSLNNGDFWANVIGAKGTQQEVANINGYTSSTGGLVAGFDKVLVNDFRLGGAVGYASSSINDWQMKGDSLGIDTYEGIIYGSLIKPNYYINGSFGVARENYTSRRNIVFQGFGDYTAGSYSGILYTGRLDGGLPFHVYDQILMPVASLTYAHLDQNSYSETSSAGAGLAVAQAQTGSFRTGLGLKGLFALPVSPAFATALEARAIWQREFGSAAQTVSASFIGSGTSFIATGPAPARESADLGAGLKLAIPTGQIFSLDYNALLRANYVEQSGTVRVQVVF